MSTRYRGREEEEDDEGVEDTVIISVTYGEDTIDILTSVKEVFQHSKELGDEIPKVLQEILDQKLDSIPGIKRMSPPSSSSSSAKRTKTDSSSSTTTVNHTSLLSPIQSRIQAWGPSKKHTKRIHGKTMYLGLLQALKQSTSKQVQPILQRLQQHWKSQPSDFGDSFMSELSTLCKECSAVPELSSTVSTLLSDFKRNCA
jgi:hypothetical protein